MRAAVRILRELTMPDNGYDAEMRLAQAGYRRLGKGNYATVWARPDDDYVVKLFAVRDSAYLAYLEWAKTLDVPWVPKLKSGRIWKLGSFLAVRLERLESAPGRLIEIMNMIDERLTHADPDHQAEQLRNEDPRRVPKLQAQYAYSAKLLRQYEKAQPEMVAALRAIYAWCKDKRFHPDIHSGNVMMRGKQFVLVDPVSD
jgi:hypothetical protein